MVDRGSHSESIQLRREWKLISRLGQDFLEPLYV